MAMDRPGCDPPGLDLEVEQLQEAWSAGPLPSSLPRRVWFEGCNEPGRSTSNFPNPRKLPPRDRSEAPFWAY
ncbi:MAG: hypothetical protein M1838_006173 [Thelocarpon superellum]|nr:MAG: hypothetical protein M1838_006173 [Thelocarpon superellum]